MGIGGWEKDGLGINLFTREALAFSSSPFPTTAPSPPPGMRFYVCCWFNLNVLDAKEGGGDCLLKPLSPSPCWVHHHHSGLEGSLATSLNSGSLVNPVGFHWIRFKLPARPATRQLDQGTRLLSSYPPVFWQDIFRLPARPQLGNWIKELDYLFAHHLPTRISSSCLQGSQPGNWIKEQDNLHTSFLSGYLPVAC